MIKSILNYPVNLVQSLLSSIGKGIQSIIQKYKKPVVPNFLSIGALAFSLVLATVVTIASITIQPFGIEKYASANKLMLQIGQGVASLAGLAFSLFLLPLIFQKFYNKDKWSVAKNLSSDVIAIFFMGLFLMVFSNQTGITHFELPQALLISTAIGTAILAVVALTREGINSKSFKSKALTITQKLHQEGIIENKGSLFPVTKFVGSNDIISLLPNQLIKVKVGKFESEFIYQNMFGIATKTLEVTAKDVLKELSQFEQFIPLNKTTFVNKNAIIEAQGDGAGIKIKVNKNEELIRVRKKYLKSF